MSGWPARSRRKVHPLPAHASRARSAPRKPVPRDYMIAQAGSNSLLGFVRAAWRNAGRLTVPHLDKFAAALIVIAVVVGFLAPRDRNDEGSSRAHSAAGGVDHTAQASKAA